MEMVKGHAFMRKDISDLIQANHVCVLATVADGKPHCALMTYIAAPDSREIYMLTQRDTKKVSQLGSKSGCQPADRHAAEGQ